MSLELKIKFTDKLKNSTQTKFADLTQKNK
jgi:hypothetical protein